MLLRRAAALQPLLDQLNPQAYLGWWIGSTRFACVFVMSDLPVTCRHHTHLALNARHPPTTTTALHKMLSFELAEIYAALMEMKGARIESKLEQDAGT